MSGIRSPNLPLGTTLGEFLGNEIDGNTRSLKRFSRASVIGALEQIQAGSQVGGGVAFSSKTEADSHLAYAAFQLGLVVADTDPSKNGLYQKAGASGTGAWTRIADLPNEIIQLTVTGGTADAITATMAPQVPSTPSGKLYIIVPTANNTGAALAINGITVKNSLGSTPAADTFVGGVPVSMIWGGDHYQILTSLAVDTAGVVADAVAARDAAAASATSAATSASALGNQVHQYDTRALAAAATIPAGVTLLHVYGYAAAGDGGFALYKKVGSQPSHVGKIQSADGAWWEITDHGGVLRPEMFSATADTSAIQAAVDVGVALGTVGEVHLSNRNYRAVKQGSNAWCLKLYGSVSLIGLAAGVKDGVGAGTGSIISWGSAINSSTDIIYWTGGAWDQRICGIQFMPDGFTATAGFIGAPFYGKDVINVNGVGRGIIEDNMIGPANGYSIHFSAAVNDWPAGTVNNNAIWGGILAEGILDNCRFTHNSFWGKKCALDITLTPGAGNTLIAHNNGIPAGGAVFLRNGPSVKIIDNYFELPETFTGANGYYYNIVGNVGTISDCEFKNNICQQLGDHGLIGLVYVDNTIRCDFDNNILFNTGATPIAGINISANNNKPYLGKIATSGVTPSTGNRPGYNVSSPGSVGPIGYDVPLTLQNGWTITGSGETPSVRRERDGTCHISGEVQAGTVTAGTVVFTLPAAFVPQKTVHRVVATATGGVVAQIDTGGNFTWYVAGASATLNSLACTYMTQTD